MSPDLFKAVQCQDIYEVKRLLASSADLNARDKYGNTLLHWAARNDRAAIIEILVRATENVRIGPSI